MMRICFVGSFLRFAKGKLDVEIKPSLSNPHIYIVLFHSNNSGDQGDITTVIPGQDSLDESVKVDGVRYRVTVRGNDMFIGRMSGEANIHITFGEV